jgi:putative DNA primase/helicase
VPDDDEIATELADKLKGRISYFRNAWHVYERGCWTSRHTSEVRRYVRQELRGWRARGIKVQQRRIACLASMLEDEMFMPDRSLLDQQAEQRRYVNLRNGLFDLETMQFTGEHRPELYFTTQLGFEFDEDATCPTFRRFLETSLVLPDSSATDPELVRLALEALAYSMTARTDLKASFWLIGKKDSGKSTFISVLRNIMGALHATIDLTQLGANRFLLASFAGKRVVTFTEASGSSVLPDAIYKTLVGGSDEVYADVKNKEPIMFRNEAKLWWAMNDWPRMVDRSGATTRRIYMIPFNRTIPERLRIYDLEDRLTRERPGIFNEMVIHYRRLIRAGDFEKCGQSSALKHEYIMQNDTEATFAEERLELGDSYTIQAQPLYAAYREWCQENGFGPKARNQVSADWKRLGLSVYKDDKHIYKGARLRV